MDYLFYNSLLLFSEENVEKIKNAKVAICGVGGVGSIITEMLTRIGVNNIKVADNDKYHEHNMNRQLFATLDTVGISKALAAEERIRSINPNCNVGVYADGIDLEDIYDFCKGSDLIFEQSDKESIKVLTHKVAKELCIPVIMGSRVSIDNESRWCVRAKLWDYKENPDLPTFGETNHPELEKYSIKEMTPEILHKYDEFIKKKKINTFKAIALDEKNNFFKTISKKELLEKIENNPDAYNRHVCSVIANTAGCLAATLAIRYIVGEKTEQLQIDLMQ